MRFNLSELSEELKVGTPRIFNDLLRKEAGMQAAWLPLTNTFELGDYGVVSGGVFNKIGNIRSFLSDSSEQSFDISESNESLFRLASEGVYFTRLNANGAVGTFEDLGDAEATLEIEFSESNSFYINGTLTVYQMSNVRELAEKLSESDGWSSKFQVIRHIYRAKNCTLLSSSGVGAKVSLSGSASSLQSLEQGAASSAISRNSNEKIGLELVGASGVLGLRLFKTRWIVGGVSLLGNHVDRTAIDNIDIIYDDISEPLDDDI